MIDRLKKEGFCYCMHAGGEIYNQMLTNSIQGFSFWKQKGYFFFEFDVNRTKDGRYVTTHDLEEDITSTEFVSKKQYVNQVDYVNGMDLEYLITQIDNRSFIYLMIDPKNFTYAGTFDLLLFLKEVLSNHHIDGLQNVVVELYNPEMIKASRHFKGIVNFQYCVDDDIQQGNSHESRSLPPENLIKYLMENEIHMVSYPWKQAVNNLSLLKMFSDNDFIVFSRTRNDLFYPLLRRARINVNIIDHIITSEQRQTLSDYKSDYFTKYEPLIKQYFS